MVCCSSPIVLRLTSYNCLSVHCITKQICIDYRPTTEYCMGWKLNKQVIPELRRVTCHTGSRSVTFHPTQVNTSHLTPARQVGTQFTYSGGIEGRVNLGGWEHMKMAYLSANSHPVTSQGNFTDRGHLTTRPQSRLKYNFYFLELETKCVCARVCW